MMDVTSVFKLQKDCLPFALSQSLFFYLSPVSGVSMMACCSIALWRSSQARNLYFWPIVSEDLWLVNSHVIDLGNGFLTQEQSE